MDCPYDLYNAATGHKTPKAHNVELIVLEHVYNIARLPS